MDFSTKLNTRILRFDGVSIVSSNEVLNLFQQGITPTELRILEENDEIKEFNSFVNEEYKLKLNSDFTDQSFDFNWKLPIKYLELDIKEYVLQCFLNRLSEFKYTQEQEEQAALRIDIEFQEFDKRNLLNLLRTIVYVLDRFKETNSIYGVGRGSSCASYILFVLNLHMIDPIKYHINLDEFFH